MPAQVRSEFTLALNQICSERNLDPEVVLDTIKQALLIAYRQDRRLAGENINVENILSDIDSASGEFAIYEKNEDGSKGKNITPPGFGRIASQTAGQVLRQKIREAEKKSIIADFTQKVGGIINGTIVRFEGPNIIIDINKVEAVMPPQEQVREEHYRLNQRLVFYIESIRESPRGQEIIVSRAHKNLVIELFRREVPELQNNSIEVKVIAREAGGRTKLAVASLQSGVDPVGACVGQKGVRVQAVISELGGMEKVDIIQWSDDAKSLISQALSPAKDIDVLLDDKTKTAKALVPEDQLSLAIGKEGQNARLASKLTGWKIDISGKGGPKPTAPSTQTPVDDTTTQQKQDDTNQTPPDTAQPASDTMTPVDNSPTQTPPDESKIDEKEAISNS